MPVPTDEGGLIPEAITPELADGARFLYALPNFQNPTGRTLNLERRIALVKRAAELNLTIVEDDPCLLYTSPSPRDRQKSRMPSSA